MKRQFNLKSVFVMLFALVFAISFICFAPAVKAEDSSELPDNGIPVIYVNIDESQGTIKDMLESPDHSDYCYGAISIDVPEGFHYADFPGLACESMENLAMSIRGRGNSTWMKSEKKPFKIKLDKKADVFGLGKNKHWVLVANKFDTSLLRDRITAWLSEQMNFEFTPRGVPVDLVFTGEEYGTHYMGSYYFSENVRVDENRLEIDELKEDDVDEPVITGGYLLQDSLQVRAGSPDIFFTKHHVDWATHTPSFDTEEDAALGDNEEGLVGGTLLEESFAGAELGDGYENHVQQTYIQNHIQRIEDLLYSEGTDYRELMDVESAAKYWLINIFPLNADAYITGSTYIYKKRDTDGVTGKLYWGPVWDFDYAWDNKADTTGFPVRHEWIKALFCDREEGGFVEEVRKQWIPMREAVVKLIEDGGLIDQYAAETKASAEQDYPVNHAEDDPEEFDYPARVEQLKQWIRDRLAWVDENLDMLDTLAHRVILDVDKEIYDITYKAHGEFIEDINDVASPPVKEGYFFLGWADEDGNIVRRDIQVNDEMTLTAQFISDEEAVHAQDIAFRKDSDVILYNSHVSMYTIDYEIVPPDANDKDVFWSSSNEEYATVDETGTVTFKGPGEVTITARLNNGKTREFTLTVAEEGFSLPEEIIPETEEILLEPGEYAPLVITTEPPVSKIQTYTYVSDDENVVTVDAYGVLHAVGEGETIVHLETASWDFDGNETVCSTAVKVIVGQKAPVPEEIVYTVVSGGESTWKKTDKAPVLTVKRNIDDETCFAHFQSVFIDDKELKKDTDYTAKAGSTVITISSSYLKTLKEGEHTVTVLFDDGKAETKISIAVSEKPAAPDTSDHVNPAWPYIMGAALIIFAIALRQRLRYTRGG